MAAFKKVADVAKLGLQNASQGTKRVATETARAAQQKTVVAKQATKTAAINGTKKVVKSSLKDVKNKDGSINKTMGNLWTGKKLNPLHVGVLAGGYLGAQNMGKSINFQTKANLDMGIANDYQNYGAPDVMSYDGVSQQKAPQNLNANGSIVFGLHNSRKG